VIKPLVAGDEALVLGLGLYGVAVARALRSRGIDVTVAEDRPTDRTATLAEEIDVTLMAEPAVEDLVEALARADAFVPSPGVPEQHDAFAAAVATGVPTISEFDMARWWDDRPIIAITGTDGKTTVTMLTVEMLQHSGVAAAAVGNNDLPLIEAIDDPQTSVFVVEASSFRLAHTQRFSPRAAAWLNFAPDHLDVHLDLTSYEEAKASIWADLPVDGLAVATLADPTVMKHVPPDRRVSTIGLTQGTSRVVGDELSIDDVPICRIDELPRQFNHDITNTLTAATLALELGATRAGVRNAIMSSAALPHRIQFVETIEGIDFYNDSKATVPHAVVTATGSFDSVILIAGGRNKGLDLRDMASRSPSVREVVAIGEAAPDIESAFEGLAPITVAQDMREAVRTAFRIADPGEVVLLSPGCASYDSYTSYVARGEDFIGLVAELAKDQRDGDNS